MSSHIHQSTQPSNQRAAFWLVALLVTLALGYSTRSVWSPHLQALVASFGAEKTQGAHGHAGHDELGQNRGNHDNHAGHGELTATGMEDSIRLTSRQQKNLGMTTAIVKPARFTKYVVVPAVVVDRPGRSKVQITAHAAGIVTNIFPLERQVVEPGMPLLGMRLIHEDIVSLQAEFLKMLSQKDMLIRELRRLEGIGPGIVAGKRIIEKRNQLDLLKNEIDSLRQSLVLHGVESEQVDAIVASRELLQEEVVTVPSYPQSTLGTEDQSVEPRERDSDNQPTPQYHVQSINVDPGQTVQTGQTLLTLAEYSQLYLEGQAFADDAIRLISSANRGQQVAVIVKGPDGQTETLNLSVESVADTIDPETRALNFYLILPNKRNGVALPASNRLIGQTSAARKFVAWKFRPGQRMEVRIPVGPPLENKIVLPIDAVVIDGPNAFVFEQNGDYFDRVEVAVLHRDNHQVVIENDGSLPGAVIAISGAYRMYLALKNEDSGGFDPHAGHSH